MKSQNHKRLALVALLISLVFVVTNVTAKKPDTRPPKVEPVFTALEGVPNSGDLLILEDIDSHSSDKSGQIVFRGTLIDLDQFKGTNVEGEACTLIRPGLNGIMVLSPKSRRNPAVAKLVYWFQAFLDSGDTVTHWFVMEGDFDPDVSWPPQDIGDETTLFFHSWEFSAENKWAQRQDCAGEGYDFDNPWTVTITRIE